MVKIGRLELGRVPRIAVAVDDKAVIRPADRKLFDIIEIRADMFNDISARRIRSSIAMRRKSGAPVILTVRSKSEGAVRRIPDERRLSIIRDNISFVDAVDMELSSAILPDVLKAARKAKKKVIVSMHDFKKTPSDAVLNNILFRSKKAGADIVKIACRAVRARDIERMRLFTLKNKRKNIITISLGPAGASSRVIFPKMGSLITYSYINNPSGPGQIPLKKLRAGLQQ